MIVQVSSTIVPEPRLAEYLEHLQQKELPIYRAAPGFLAVSVLKRYVVAYGEVLTISAWQSETALRRFAADRFTAGGSEKPYGEIQIWDRFYKLVTTVEGQQQEQDLEQSGS